MRASADVTAQMGFPLGKSRKFVQLAWIVPDLESAVARWAKTTGVGPFVMFANPQFDALTYRGKPATIRMRGAVAQAGDMQIELIEQRCQSRSAYRDTVPAGGTGFHHMAALATDFDQEIKQFEAAGVAIAAQGRFGALRFAYVDTSEILGFMIELLDVDDATREVYAKISRLALDWDGTRPLRSSHEL
jgi:hypothetical protein